MSILEAELTSLAFCWRLERRDGVTIGFTTHDRDLELEDLTYRSAPGMLPSAISLSDGFDPDNLEVSGALTSDAVRAEDLESGRWDGARASIFMLDWESPGSGAVPIAEGVIGNIGVGGNGFSAELRGLTMLLDQPVVEQTSPECRAQLGDKRCRVDMAARVRITRVTQVGQDGVFHVAEANPAPVYSYGRVRWISGANSGLNSTILISDNDQITLREPPPNEIRVGDLLELAEGCDKSLDTCRTRFQNSVNFRGEPHLPGFDLLTRYPGS